MLIGVTAAGRTADGQLRRAPVLPRCALPTGWAAPAAAGTRPVPPFAVTIVQGGLSFGIGSTLVHRVMVVASGAPSLSGSCARAALHVGAFLGPLLTGAATGTAHDYRHAAWVSAALAAVAAAVTVTSRTRAVDADAPEAR
ncbi:hypothetical protein ACIQGZ_26045 [Streptomyces sp. NPDC092296]|uniref:hypothetical protein n=1 Tax=Streptomyces sp. NPDC092296 TaxID=3366012 RepID=UPI003820BF9F